jgi:hypothetical protein
MRNEIYQGQLVYVGEGNGPDREGTVEVTEGIFALVRFHVADSRQQFAQQVSL